MTDEPAPWAARVDGALAGRLHVSDDLDAPVPTTWVFGDGEQQTVRTAGRTEHVYTRNRAVTARVDVTWTGTFRVDGGPAQPINGTVTTRGQDVTVTVKQARSELIGG